MSETIADLRQYGGEALASLGDELPLNGNPGQLVASVFIKSGAGRLFGLAVTNTNAATRYIQIFDKGAGIPAEGAVPTLSYQVNAGQTLSVSWGTLGRYFGAGLWVLNSTTQATKTLGSADSLIDAQYI